MQKLVIALLIIATLVGGYRFVSSRKKAPPETPVEVKKTKPTVSPTLTETTTASKTQEQTGQDLPSAGGSTEKKPALPPEKLQEMIDEFEKKE